MQRITMRYEGSNRSLATVPQKSGTDQNFASRAGAASPPNRGTPSPIVETAGQPLRVGGRRVPTPRQTALKPENIPSHVTDMLNDPLPTWNNKQNFVRRFSGLMKPGLKVEKLIDGVKAALAQPERPGYVHRRGWLNIILCELHRSGAVPVDSPAVIAPFAREALWCAKQARNLGDICEAREILAIVTKGDEQYKHLTRLEDEADALGDYALRNTAHKLKAKLKAEAEAAPAPTPA